jgi:Gpi18-like mannosyltransferase
VRLYVFATLYLFFLHTGLRPDRKDFVFREEGQSEKDREAEIQANFWERLGPFDGQFYLDIAHNGYRTIHSSIHGSLGNYAFFPLLPAILASLGVLAPGAYVPLAIALTLLGAIVGTWALWRLAERCGTNALLAVGALLCFPSAPFQYALYTEGLFLGLSGLALNYSLQRKPLLALTFGLLAGLSRPQGVLLAIPMFVELVLPSWKDRRRGQHVPLVACLAVSAPLSGFLVLGIVSTAMSGSPLWFLGAQETWGRSYEATGLLQAIKSIFAYVGPPMDLLGLVVGVGLIPLMWKKLPLSLSLYGVAAVLMPLATGSILSFARFMSVSLPHMLGLAILLQSRGRATRIAALAIFVVLQSLVARGLIGWHFVG